MARSGFVPMGGGRGGFGPIGERLESRRSRTYPEVLADLEARGKLPQVPVVGQEAIAAVQQAELVEPQAEVIALTVSEPEVLDQAV